MVNREKQDEEHARVPPRNTELDRPDRAPSGIYKNTGDMANENEMGENEFE